MFLKKESSNPYFFSALFFAALLLTFLILNLVFGWNPPTASQPNPAGQTLYSDSSNNIGIGTLYPGSKLEVFSTSSDSILKLSRGPSSSTSTILKLGTDSAFIIQNQSTDAFTIKSGNVGIATTTPGSSLTVAGTIYSSTGGFKFPDNTTQTTEGSTGYKVISVTRDLSLTSDQTITGAGFTPKAADIIFMVEGTWNASWGYDDGSSRESMFHRPGQSNTLYWSNNFSIKYAPNESTISRGYFSSFNSDGGVIHWENVGSPTGTAQLIIKFYK